VSIDGGKSASFSNQGCGKLLAGLQSRSFTGVFIMVHFFQDNLFFERLLIVNVFFVPLFVWAIIMMEYGICLKKLAALLIDRNFRLVSSQRESVQSWWVTKRLKAAETFLGKVSQI